MAVLWTHVHGTEDQIAEAVVVVIALINIKAIKGKAAHDSKETSSLAGMSLIIRSVRSYLTKATRLGLVM